MSLQNLALNEACLNALTYKFIEKHQCLIFAINENTNEIHIALSPNSAPLGLIRAHILNLFPKVHLHFFNASSQDFTIQAHRIYLFQHFNTLKIALIKQHTNQNQNVDSMSAVALLDFILLTCIEQKASDVHFESFIKNGESGARIRARIDGLLQEIFHFESYVLESLSSRLKLECELDITQTRQAQDGRFSRIFNDVVYDFRLSILPSFGGESIVIRILCKNAETITLQSLGFKSAHLALIAEQINANSGIVFLTGPTGSGKSTTLHAMLESIKSPQKKIITLEDPIEYHTELTTQVLIHDKYDFGFSKALRALLRHDPDILMIGEIRDKQSLDIALRASLTGHLVLSTLHANDSLSVVERLLDMGAQSYLLASSVRLVISQRLVRTLCESCKVSIESQVVYDKLSTANLAHLWEDIKNGSFYAPSGCVHCNMQGFSGRTLCAEVLPISPMLCDYIISPHNKAHILTALKERGFKTLLEESMELLKNGQSSFEEIYRVCHI